PRCSTSATSLARPPRPRPRSGSRSDEHPHPHPPGGPGHPPGPGPHPPGSPDVARAAGAPPDRPGPVRPPPGPAARARHRRRPVLVQRAPRAGRRPQAGRARHGRLPVRPRRLPGPVPAPARCARGRGGRAGRGGQRLHGAGGALVSTEIKKGDRVLVKPGQIWQWNNALPNDPALVVTKTEGDSVHYRYESIEGEHRRDTELFTERAHLVTDTTPAPLDPSKVKPGDTVTLTVDPP